MKTFMAKANEVDRKYYIVDASEHILGHMAVKVADTLRGKNKPIFTPHADTGDFVIVINAAKLKVSGKKMQQKTYQRYSGYPSGLTTVKLADMVERAPEQVVRLAVNRMIPAGPLGNSIRTKLKIYAGADHPHQAQKPIPLEV